MLVSPRLRMRKAFDLRHFPRTLLSLNAKTNFLREYRKKKKKCFRKIYVVGYLHMHKTSNSSKYKIQSFLEGTCERCDFSPHTGSKHSSQKCAVLKKSVFYKIINFREFVNPTKNMTPFLYNSIFLKTTLAIWTSIGFVEI